MSASPPSTVFVGVSGASGAPYALRLVQALAPLTPTNTVDGGEALMAGNGGRSRPPSSRDGAAVALAAVAALRPRSVVAVALHAHGAITEHCVGVVVPEGRTVRQGHAVTRGAE